jgi:hypothetical protein
MAELRTVRWQGAENTYRVPWSRKRVAFSAEPEQLTEFRKCPFTRSKLSMDMLVRFHLSNNSIVVSEDSVALFLRGELRQHAVASSRYPAIAEGIVTDVFGAGGFAVGTPKALSSDLIRVVYLALLRDVLGVRIGPELRARIGEAEFKRGTRPMEVDGLLFALARILPGVRALRCVVDRLIFKGNHYTRVLAARMEDAVVESAEPEPGSWYEKLKQLERDGRITHRQLRGEVTSILVSSYTLSAALASLLLCVAARPDEVERIRTGELPVRSFVNEVLRLYPPFRYFGYEHLQVPDGRSRVDADLVLSVGQLHRNPNVWADAHLFQPSRFDDAGSTTGDKFVPFGVGARACSGRAYSFKVMLEVLRYVSSDRCPFRLDLPSDYKSDRYGMPIPIVGRLLSSPGDDRIVVTRVGATPRSAAAPLRRTVGVS